MLFERFHQPRTTTPATRTTRRSAPLDPEVVRRRARATDGPLGGARLGL